MLLLKDVGNETAVLLMIFSHFLFSPPTAGAAALQREEGTL